MTFENETKIWPALTQQSNNARSLFLHQRFTTKTALSIGGLK